MASKEEIHALADKKGIPWDDDPKFKRWSKDLTGKAHLDDMTSGQRDRLKKALLRKHHEKTASRALVETGRVKTKELLARLAAMPKDEAIAVLAGTIGLPMIPFSGAGALIAYKGVKTLARKTPIPGLLPKSNQAKLNEAYKAFGAAS